MVRRALIFVPVLLIVNGTISYSQDSARNAEKDIMKGAIDFHVHSSPDVSARSLNDFEAAELARKSGYKAIVIKSHVSSTVGRVVLVNLKVQNIMVFGGIVLNEAVGGINPHAVEVMHKMSPQFGKVVWFPTIDAAFSKRQSKADAQGLTVLKNNKLSRETIEVLKIIATEELVLATGHLSPKEILLLVPEAKKMGVNKILVTHAMGKAPGLTIAQMSELAKWGAIFELSYLNVLTDQNPSLNVKKLSVQDMVEAIKQIGARHFLISSDLGQTGNPLPPDGMRIFVSQFLQKGISIDEMELMIKTNPARLLGIE